jgi:acetyl esterase/lipase
MRLVTVALGMASVSAARVKLPVSTTRMKARIAESWSIGIHLSRLQCGIVRNLEQCNRNDAAYSVSGITISFFQKLQAVAAGNMLRPMKRRKDRYDDGAGERHGVGQGGHRPRVRTRLSGRRIRQGFADRACSSTAAPSSPPDCRTAVAEAIASAGAIVVVADYNAPMGGVFPKPLEVGYSLFSYMANKRASGLGDRNSLLLVAGEEAGGNIAASVAFKARDHYADALDGQVLISPLVDPFMGTSSIREADAIGMRERWAAGWSHYLSGGGCHPYAAPCLCSRISGVAPALIFTAKDDPLRDETLGFADRLKQAGVAVRQHVPPPGQAGHRFTAGRPTSRRAGSETITQEFGSFVRDMRRQPIALKTN